MERVRASEAEILESVSRVLRGEREAFALLVREYQGLILRICRGLLNNPEDAEDAAQEVFYRAFRALGSFRLDRRFTPWIAAIAVNTAKSYYRSRGRRTSKLAAVEPDSLPSGDCVEGEGERRVMVEAVRSAVERLPEKLREVVVLYYLEELDVSDVAEALQIGRENVKSRLHRARVFAEGHRG